jgi:60 kDa SS-A/Ro ribonucleoprotein
MKKYLTNVVRKKNTPQSQPMPGTNQVRNSAGGYSWQVDQWDRLKRFLVLGSEGGSYYASEQTLTVDNANHVMKCIQDDGLRVVNELVAISQAGHAPKNDPAIFALALAASVGNDATRKAALDVLPQVCRIGTHLFSFAEIIGGMRGWGRGLRRSVGKWYTEKDARRLAYQVVKYRQRNGWTHTDTLRLAHPNPETDAQSAIFNWVARHDEAAVWAQALTVPEDEALAFIWAFEQAQKTDRLEIVLELVAKYDLPREALPTQWLKEITVWEALLEKMPMTAMIRNLGNMTKCGLIAPGSDAEQIVVERLTDAERLRKARVHPISMLSALRVYGLGYPLRGRATRSGIYVRRQQVTELVWKPTARVMDALDSGFELAFQNIKPTNKRYMLALDVSGSMSMGLIAGVAGLTPREGSAAMAMVTARTERKYSVISFQDKIVPLNISARMRLDDVVKATSNLPFGRTDCVQPMLYALKKKIKVDAFVIYTDSETWFGKTHPVEALREYRQKMGIDARLIVVGMVSNDFTIADPNDAGMLDVVGFDSAAPGLIADFVRGEL